MSDFSRAPRVLVVEDDEDIAQALQRSLRMEGYEVRAAGDGNAAIEHGRAFAPDLVILDLGLPGLDGIEVAKRLRADDDVPILILTARDGLESRVEGLDAGADDYLVKPFALAEFEARVRALLRRLASHGTPEWRMGRLRLDLPGHRAWADDQPLELTAREFGLLAALALRPERVTSRAQLIEALCDWDQELTDNGLDIAIHRLRRKLHGSGVGVRTIRGLGYMLQEEASASEPPADEPHG